MLLEAQQSTTAAFAHCPANLKADKDTQATRSFRQIIICISKLPQYLRYTVECVVTAWDTRWSEEFSERGPNFLNYVQ